MTRRCFIRTGALILLTVFFMAPAAAPSAASSPRWDMGDFELWDHEKEQTPWTKLGRGAGNVVFGWCEIFRQPALMSRENAYTTSFFGGIPKGLLFAAGRMIVGAYEVVTFPVPAPEGYEPIIVPETAVYSS